VTDAGRIGLVREAVEPGGPASSMLARRFAAEII
jgi:hypothetical protein